MIINAASHTMKNIWRFFLVIFIFVILLFVLLTNGIRIENLELPKIKISQLYIKLDKKFIVDIDTLNIDIKSEKDDSLEELHGITSNLPYLYSFFKSISIKNIIFDNKTIHFLYKDEIFYVDSDFLTINAKIRDWEDSIEVEIKQMVLKDFHLKVKGNLKAKMQERLFNFRGNFSTFNIKGALELRVEKDELRYRLNTKKFATLKPFMDFLSKKIDLSPSISTWIYKKIVAKEYQVHNLEGKLNLDTLNYYPKLMKARVGVKDAVVKFHKDAPSALINNLDVVLKDDELIFDIKKAHYQGKDISTTKIHIYHLMSAGAGILLDINGDIMFDDSIHAILHAYDIKVPVTQTVGLTKTNVTLDISFSEGIKSYSGHFEMSDANITLSGLPLYSKSADVKLDNGMIYLNSTNLKYDTIFDIYTTGDLNLTSGVYKSDNQIKTLRVNSGKLNILDMRDINSTATMKIKESGTYIYIDSLKTGLELYTKQNKIIVKKLSLISPHSKLMHDFGINSGDLEIDTADFQNYNIKAKLKDIDLPLSQNGNKLKDINLSITTDGKNLKLLSEDKTIKITKKRELKMLIKDTDVMIDSSKNIESDSIDKVVVEGINSNIIDTSSKLKILSNHFIYTKDGNHTTFESKLFNESISMEQTNKMLYLKCNNLTDIFINTFFDKNAVENGSFEFQAKGENAQHLLGTFVATNTTIRGMTFYNNLMALVHTIPSLVTFKNPGFNDDGYVIDSATVDFSKIGDMLTLKEIKIDGKSADIIGDGTIDLKTKEINIVLQISVLKNLSSIVNNIPVVNYIFLGKDGRMYTKVNIKGTISEPHIATNVIQDTTLSPFGIIKRTLETPFRIFQ